MPTMKKDVLALVSRLEKSGHRVRTTRSGHYAVLTPSGKVVILPGSGGAGRGLANAKALLRREGCHV